MLRLVIASIVPPRRRMLLRVLTAISLLIGAPALMPSAHAHGITLVVQHYLPADSPVHTTFILPWIQKLEEESSGLLRFRLFPAMGHGGQPAQLADQVSSREIDIALLMTNQVPGRFPAIETFETLPIQHSASGASRAAWEFVRLNDLNDKEFEEARPLAVAVVPGTDGVQVCLLLMNARAIKSLSDEQRKVINANSGATASAALARVLSNGASTTAKPSQGAIDAWNKRAAERGINGRILTESARELLSEHDTAK